MSGISVRVQVSPELREAVSGWPSVMVGAFAHAPEIQARKGEPVSVDNLTLVSGTPVGPGFVQVTEAREEPSEPGYVYLTLEPA